MKNKDFKVILASNYEIAKPFDGIIEATVEAEYGANVVKGTEITLAHHTNEYSHYPAPINSTIDMTVKNILVSHLDLDTIGGIMNITGNKIKDDDFAQAAEYIDVNGPHHLYKFPEQKAKIEAYWAWNASQPRSTPSQDIVDVTDKVILSIEAIERILSGDKELIELGQKWAKESTEKVEACLISETKEIRIFATDDVFCNGAYYSPKQNKVVPFVISFNTKFGSISVSCASADAYRFNAKDFVQALWGKEAGGHNGIAGSPRGQRMTFQDFYNVVEVLSKR